MAGSRLPGPEQVFYRIEQRVPENEQGQEQDAQFPTILRAGAVYDAAQQAGLLLFAGRAGIDVYAKDDEEQDAYYFFHGLIF